MDLTLNCYVFGVNRDIPTGNIDMVENSVRWVNMDELIKWNSKACYVDYLKDVIFKNTFEILVKLS